MTRYDGPIIDAHHHLWDLAAGHYPWLTDPAAAIPALGNYDDLRRDYLPADYAADSAGLGITATVHAEAVWDPARHPAEETAWLDTLPRPPGLAARLIVAAPLGTPGAAAVLEAQEAASRRVAAVRQTIRWHPDPAKRWNRAGILAEPAWRAGLALVTRRGWALDLLMNPYQAADVAALARDVPGQRIVVNHCGTPLDRDAAGLQRWRDGLALMAAAPNVAIKLSNFASYRSEATPEGDADTLHACIDAFGPARCMFGSDYPVARRIAPLAQLLERFRAAVARYTAEEQRALFHDTAARVYRFPELQAAA